MALELGLDVEVVPCHDKELSSYKINIRYVSDLARLHAVIIDWKDLTGFGKLENQLDYL
jgi:hypothetical protein